jgi:hypothetical protein
MEENGYEVRVENTDNPWPVKEKYRVPPTLQGCHTAIVDGYVVEGHVPVDAVERLLAERPDVLGIAVPGMPVGSPGMEVDGAAPAPFDVLTFDGNGDTTVYASYNQ